MAKDRLAPSVGWYGKVPTRGDFVSRHLATAFIAKWDQWLEAGMTAIREASPDSWQLGYSAAPVWNALLPADVASGNVCLAAIAPSADRVGRRFPFCVIVSLSSRQGALGRFTSLPDFCARMADASNAPVRDLVSLDEFDHRLAALVKGAFREDVALSQGALDIAEVLGKAALDLEAPTVPMSADALFPWPDLIRSFEPTGPTSYWWTSISGDKPVRGFTHGGALDSQLFVTLFATNRDSETVVAPAR